MERTKMKCQRCKGTKHLSKNSVNTNGKVQYICRDCNTDKFQKYRKTKNGKNKTYKAVYKSIKKYPKKQSARFKVYLAIKSGELCKPSMCQDCFKRKELFGHHEDYSKPLEVEWLCRNCHLNRHKL